MCELDEHVFEAGAVDFDAQEPPVPGERRHQLEDARLVFPKLHLDRVVLRRQLKRAEAAQQIVQCGGQLLEGQRHFVQAIDERLEMVQVPPARSDGLCS